MDREPRRAGARTIASLIALALCLTAAPGARADTKSELADAMEEVAALLSSAEAATQKSRAAQEQLAEVEQALATAGARLEEQVRMVESSRKAMGRAARASYAAGGMDAALYLLLADDGKDMLRAADDLRRVSDGLTAGLAADRQLERDLAQAREHVATQQAAAQALRDESASSAAVARQRLREAQAREAALERKYAAEVAQQRRAAQEEAARQSAAARQSQAANISAGAAPAFGTAPAAGGGRAQIVAFALNKVGGRYVFGADGPNAYDCSGLVAAAYAAGGIRVPSYTGSLAKRAQRIPMSAAAPGDVLFYFGRGAQHVAIYLGDGRMVHAVNPRRGIIVSSVNESWYRERFTMAGRIVG